MNEKFKKLLSLETLGGDFRRIYDDVAAKRDILVFGLNTPSRAHIAFGLNKFVLYVVKDGTYALKAEEALSDFFDPSEIGYLPEKDDVLIYRKAFQATSLTHRVTAERARLKRSALSVSTEIYFRSIPQTGISP